MTTAPSRYTRLGQTFRRWRRKHLRTSRERTEDMITDFVRDFPGRCMICAHHYYGYMHGLTKSPQPVKHTCIEYTE